MFARITFITVSPNHHETVKKIYNKDITPVIKSQKGNVGCWLLEPTDAADDFISLTEWLSKADSDAYESSGIYRTLVEMVKPYYTVKPILKTYTVTESVVPAETPQ